jgi:hypothetical protein
MASVRRLTAILAADVAGYSRLMGSTNAAMIAKLPAIFALSLLWRREYTFAGAVYHDISFPLRSVIH